MSFTRVLTTLALVLALASNPGCRTGLPWSGKKLASRSPAPEVIEERAALSVVEQKVNLLQARATLCEMENQSSEAMRCYESILQIDDRNPTALHRLAILHIQQGSYPAAEALFAKALESAPADNSAALHNDYGYYCYLRGNTETAINHLCQALSLDSHFGEAHNNLGLAYARLGRFREAEFEFQRAGCSRAEELNNLAFSQLMESDLQGANQTYSQALQLDPQQATARRGLASINQVTLASVPAASEPNRVEHAQPVQQVSYDHRPSVSTDNRRATQTP